MIQAHTPRTVALLALFVLFVLLLLAGCRPPQQGDGGGTANGSASARSVRAEVVDGPRLGPAQLRITVLDEGEPVEGATVEVTGDMTHAGMIPVIAAATGADGSTGVYLTDSFEFTMAGDWVLTVDVTYPDGDELQETVYVTVPGS